MNYITLKLELIKEIKEHCFLFMLILKYQN